MYRRVLIAVAVVAVLLGGLWFARHRIVTAVKEWRALALVEKAESAPGGDGESVRFATAAWQLGPRKIETLRRLMEHGRKVALPDLPAITLLVFFHDERLPSDRENILGWALDRRDPTFFDQLYPNLDEEAKAAPSMRLLHARKLAMQGRIVESLEEARLLEDVPGLEIDVSLLLAELLAQLQGNPLALQQSRERILELLRHEDDGAALRAWRMLPALPPAVRDPGPDFDPLAWLEGRADTDVRDQVFARRLLVGRLPETERHAEMDRQVEALLKDPAAMPLLVRWYLEEKRGGKLLEFPEEAFLADGTVFSSRLQVLLEVGRFDEAREWLKRAPKDFPQAVSGSLEAVFLRREGKSSEALSAWRRVIDRAENLQVYGDCVSVLQIAERFGEEKAAADVVEVIAKIPPSRLPASEYLAYLEARFSGRHGEWLKFWQEISRFRPGDAFAMEQVAFLELATETGVDPARTLEKTQQTVRRFPSVPRYRATHALWLMRAGRDGEALDLLREGDTNWTQADPALLAAYILALHRTGSSSEAKGMEGSIRWAEIPPVRRALFAELFNSWKQADAS